MQEYYATKRPAGWLWTGNLTRKEVLARVEKGQLSREWLICPRGAANCAVTVALFVDDPEVFIRQKQQETESQNVRRAIIASVEKPLLLRTGQHLIRAFFVCLLAGGGIVKIFFPQMINAGFTPITLMILIPIWSIGGVGLLAVIAGWLQHRYRIFVTLKSALSPEQMVRPGGARHGGDVD